MCHDAERAAQQALCARDVAPTQQFANAAARNHVSADLHLRVNPHFKTNLPPELRQFLNIPLRLMTKMKIRAFVHFFGTQPTRQDLTGKILR